MVRPKILEHKPSFLLSFLGGTVATVLLAALLHLAPAAGLPLVDVPRLLGGVASGDPEAAFGIGFALLFLGGVLLLPPALALAWWGLPGAVIGFRGAVVKGVVWGVLLWTASGVLLPLLGALSLVDGLAAPGFFALGLGWPAALALLAAHLAYGLALAVVTAMGRGVKPLDTLGWKGYGHGAMRQVALEGDRRRAFGSLGDAA